MKKRSLSSCATVGLCLLLTACAAPKPGSDYQHTTNAIRAAEIAGAERYAPNELSVAVSHFEKADSLVRNNRLERAQKLLQISIAQADLAKAISDAEHAEAALQQLQATN